MAKKTEVIPGTKYGHLTIIKALGIFLAGTKPSTGRQRVLAKCDCGTIKEFWLTNLRMEVTKTCGCNIGYIHPSTTHGLRDHPLFYIWVSMRARCYNPNNNRYKNYGARGIIVCAEWRNDFKRFYDWAISKGWKLGLQIDRQNNNEEYSPSNCRIVTQLVNMRNTTKSFMIEYNGETKCLSEWAEYLDKPVARLYARIKKLGWTIEKTFTT